MEFGILGELVSFVHTTLLAIGLPLVLLPLAIHLINLRRQRRIPWAAMEFLLESQKRYRHWILLQQLILLALRMGAVGALTLMLAEPTLHHQWGDLIGGAVVHHVLVVDDSYSMTDRGDGTSPLERATRVVDRVIRQAVDSGGHQEISLLRFSEAARLTAGSQPAIYRQRADSAAVDRVAGWLSNLASTQSAAGPAEAIAAVARLPHAIQAENLIVYLISDFRQREWNEPTAMVDALSLLANDGARLQLIHCAPETSHNLSLVDLSPAEGLRASQVEMWMDLTVANFGEQPARSVNVQIEEDGVVRGGIELDEIQPWKEAAQRIRVRFPTAGPHAMTATLTTDAVAVDNTRYFAANVPPEFPVLVIDGSDAGRDGYYLRTALAPGGPASTGWNPQIESPDWLRSAESLASFAGVILLDVGQLEPAANQLLNDYVRDGGGVAFFVGDHTDGRHVTAQWYRDGEGWFPAPLTTPTQLRRRTNQEISDIQIVDHPLFRVFSPAQDTLLPLLVVEYYFGIDDAWQLSEHPSTAVIATVRDGGPLVLEKHHGAGRVFAFLTKLAPQSSNLGRWSNWAQTFAFPVLMNELVGQLSAHRRISRDYRVGDSIAVELDTVQSIPDLQWEPPIADLQGPSAVQGTVQEDRMHVTVTAPPAKLAGVHKLDITHRDGAQDSRWFAVNVDGLEGDLRRLDREELANVMQGIPYDFVWASVLTDRSLQLAGFAISDVLMYVLLAVLVAEQCLAFIASYHPRQREANQ